MNSFPFHRSRFHIRYRGPCFSDCSEVFHSCASYNQDKIGRTPAAPEAQWRDGSETAARPRHASLSRATWSEPAARARRGLAVEPYGDGGEVGLTACIGDEFQKHADLQDETFVLEQKSVVM